MTTYRRHSEIISKNNTSYDDILHLYLTWTEKNVSLVAMAAIQLQVIVARYEVYPSIVTP